MTTRYFLVLDGTFRPIGLARIWKNDTGMGGDLLGPDGWVPNANVLRFLGPDNLDGDEVDIDTARAFAAGQGRVFTEVA